MSRLIIPKKIGSSVIQLKQLACGISSTQWSSNQHHKARKCFEEPVLARLQDPLPWWKKNERYYELIAKIAKNYLCIPGTSVPAERVFSKAGELVSIRRNRLKPKNVNMFLFLNKNI